MKTKLNLTRLVSSIALTLGLGGGIGGLITANSVREWYPVINKPTWTPPNFLFGPVWTTLFILMGIAFYVIWQSKKTKPQGEAMKFFIVQLVLNVLWSGLFFGLRQPWLAYVDIVALWILILMTIKKFWAIKPVAGILLIPYILWVSFASFLNLAVALLN